MEHNFKSYLKGFKYFGRSFNRSVLVNDESIQRAYHTALERGEGICNRQRTLIIGDKGVGKSSTLQMLTGSYCDPSAEPDSTEGIDITICETSDLSPEWTKRSDSVLADDPKLSAAWCVCKDQDSFNGALKSDGTRNYSQTGRNENITYRRGIRHRVIAENGGQNTGILTKVHVAASVLGMQLKWTLALIIMIVINRLVGGFGPFVWVAVVSLGVFMDFNSAYRFGTACALQAILVDVTSDVLVRGIATQWNWEFTFGAATIFLCCFLSGVIGFLCGMGGRTGMAVAFCLMSRPESLTEMSNCWHRTASCILLLCLGHLLGIAILRESYNIIKSVHQWLTTKRGIITLVIACFMLFALQICAPLGIYIVSFLLGCVMGITITICVGSGRAFVAWKVWRDGYIVKKTIGFISAFIFGHLIGWRMTFPLEWIQLISIASFILRDLYTCVQVQMIQSAGIPIHIIRDQLMTSSLGHDTTVRKLIVWDFAGDSVFKAMQNSFLLKKAVFILVFNLEEAHQNREQQVEKLKQWLYSVKAHSTALDALVFIVGTHRDSVNGHVGFLEDIAALLRETVYNDFCGILAINSKNESPLFVVENSNPIDGDGILLREAIKERARERPFLKQKQPVWYLRLLAIVKEWKKEGNNPWFIKKSVLQDDACAKGFSEEQLRGFLRFCHFSGELIYRDEDEVMKEYVILEPQHLLDIMKDLLKFPPLSERKLENAEKWQTLETNGVASVDLLAEIIGDAHDLVQTVTRFLEAYNMLLPIRPADGSGFTCCIVPSHLPDAYPNECWDSATDDEEYFFDFGYVPSEIIFHRLLARCWYHNQDEVSTSSRLYRRCGIFCFKQNSVFFMLQMYNGSIKQQLIRLVVQSSDGQSRCGVQVLQWITGELENIRRKDFPDLPYKVGPSCKACSARDGQMRIKVLEICTNDGEFPTANSPAKRFLEDGRYHEVYLAPQLSVLCGSRNRRTSPESLACSGDANGYQPSLGGVDVREGSRNVMVIQAGDNSTFNLPQSQLP